MLLPPLPAIDPVSSTRRAFTLVEMLVVMLIIAILLGVSGPIVTAMKSSGDVNKTIYDLAGVLEQSRAYAMANNTYVYVGMNEMDVTQPSAGRQNAGFGRVSVAVVATRDGTQGYSSSSVSNTQTWSASYPAFTRNLLPLGKLLFFDNFHVPDLGAPPAAGGMARPALSSDGSGSMSYSFGNAQCVSATPFEYPIGSNLGAGQCTFTKVVQFDPQGVARMQRPSNPSAITPYMEIGLQQSHGASFTALAASPTSGNIAAIQVDGMTGAVRVYRP